MNLSELEQALKPLKLEPLELKPGECIKNGQTFVESHLSTLKSNSGNRRYKPYFERLLLYYQKLKTKQDEKAI